MRISCMLLGAAALLAPLAAHAHISVVSGPGFANTTQRVTFGVGHGCTGSDTYSVRVQIPADVVSVRPESASFGRASVERDAQQNVVAVMWQKEDIDVLDVDDDYYQLTLRIKVPDQAFTTLYFPTTQVCRAADGTITTVEWASTSGTESDGEPAPSLAIVPARQPGWNKFTVPVAISALDAFFSDALIVWRSKAAYSANPTTVDLIKSTAGATLLSSLAAGDEVWVKY